MKINVDINQQNALFNAYQQLDAYEVVTPGVEGPPKIVRVPYKLGANRRALVKNTNILKASLTSFEETRVSVLKEIWPDLPDGQNVNKADDPDNFNRYQNELLKLVEASEEIDLVPLPEAVVYDANEFPLAAIALLDEHGLISAG